MVIQTQIPLKKYLKLEASLDQAIYKFGIYLLFKRNLATSIQKIFNRHEILLYSSTGNISKDKRSRKMEIR